VIFFFKWLYKHGWMQGKRRARYLSYSVLIIL